MVVGSRFLDADSPRAGDAQGHDARGGAASWVTGTALTDTTSASGRRTGGR